MVELTKAISGPPPLWEIEWRVVEITSEQSGISRDRIKPSSRLIEDLHIDSLEVVELILALEQQFGVVIPDDIGRQVFVRQPVTIGVLAEIVLHQWGTGTPSRKGWFARKPSPPFSKSAPFTQLGGMLSDRDWQEGPLFEAMAPSAQGYFQFRRRTDGMRCVQVPAADVELGSDVDDALPDQRPKHRAELSGFLVDAEPVLANAYARFLNSVGDVVPGILLEWCGVTDDDRRGQHFQLAKRAGRWEPLAGTEQQPMVLVSWLGANAYALWANRRDWRWYRGSELVPEPLKRRSVRAAPPSPGSGFLPTEAQWEYAARGAEARLFPWGDEPACAERARVALHTARSTYPEKLPLASVTDQLGMSPFGLSHMAGNVWQWCVDWYAPDFYRHAEATHRNPWNTKHTGVRSERGGSWIGPADLARSSYRRGRPPAARGRCLGFRCAGPIDDLPA